MGSDTAPNTQAAQSPARYMQPKTSFLFEVTHVEDISNADPIQ